jgi:toxoflavin synthase
MKKELYDKVGKMYSKFVPPGKKYVTVPTFLSLIPDRKIERILDLGCGDGFFTTILNQFEPKEIIGIDISREMIKDAKKKSGAIKYLVEDVSKLQLDKEFDLVSAVYLLNYSKSEKDLLRICKVISEHLSTGGVFCGITINPKVKPQKTFHAHRRFQREGGGDKFKSGDKIICEIKEDGKKMYNLEFYYWSKAIYEKCLKSAGLRNIRWIKPRVSREGISKFGRDYWKEYLKNTSVIGLIAQK